MGLGAEMFDQGKILNITDEYAEIKKQHPFRKIKPEIIKIPYNLIKEYEFL